MLRHELVQLGKSTAGFMVFPDLFDTWPLFQLVSSSFCASYVPIARWITVDFPLAVFVFTLFFIVLDDDQLGFQGALVTLNRLAVVLGRLEAHEDGCDWFGGFHGVEDGVRGVVSV